MRELFKMGFHMVMVDLLMLMVIFIREILNLEEQMDMEPIKIKLQYIKDNLKIIINMVKEFKKEKIFILKVDIVLIKKHKEL